MGSRNAFANTEDKRPYQDNGTHEDRPTKRTRLADDAVASIYSQASNLATSLDCDHMILDYVAYQTIEACLYSRGFDRQAGTSPSLASNMDMSNAFVSIFKARHPSYRPDAELRLRLLLLKLVTLFTQRLTSNPTTPSRDVLQALRGSNQDRARRWIGSAIRIPSAHFDTSGTEYDLPVGELSMERNRAHVLHELGIPPEDGHYEDAFYGTSASVSLLDLVPLFMQVTAARNAMNESKLTTTWMQLASELLLQACLEQYLVFGAYGTDAIDAAFAWGHKPVEHESSADSNDINKFGPQKDEVNIMFEDEHYETELEGWMDMKTSALKLMFSSTPDNAATAPDTVTRLEKVAAQHSIGAFETQLLAFLYGLSDSISKPILVQLEDGQLDGMTQHQTTDFLAGCGINVADVCRLVDGN